MDPQQIERAIAFVVDQHAKFAAGMEDLRHRQDALQTQMETFHAETTSRFRRIFPQPSLSK